MLHEGKSTLQKLYNKTFSNIPTPIPMRVPTNTIWSHTICNCVSFQSNFTRKFVIITHYLPTTHLPSPLLFEVSISRVLTGVGLLVIEELDEFEETSTDEGAEAGTNPVDPVVVLEACCGDTWSETTGRIERSTGVIDACEF